ncbi:hypothetical protein SAMD00019534_112770 [Acytostelium subglobosum LB1]|uniref:hypothetical protein n=1 Tax=Acytostelium subglobosum LB1 TaxID=1410327 RepID=UPI000644CE8B|nr:hypothetical protein SAMD00019534_112770 [Acytostelium subglobosum LB1]GAM28101.1 hypothetical protein SAMD00019534_112770 [Acytostelium subglobosum LB1]|eukprot:XP_012749060.1 hypothetical protein SAMD00019534_112770 [Acytostelium subglobosum LB1]
MLKVSALLLVTLLTISFVAAQDVEIISSIIPGGECTTSSLAIGDKASVLYVGKLEDGTIFDASEKHGGQPFEFTLGEGKVIPGWERGVQGMCMGEKREIRIPYQLAYGESGIPNAIPPKANLLFEVTVVSIEKLSEIPFIYRLIPSSQSIGAFIIVTVFVLILKNVLQRFPTSDGKPKPRTKPSKESKKKDN